MTIALKNQVMVKLTITQTPYHLDLTLEKLYYFLDISPKATILINSIQFMLNIVECRNEFLQRYSFAKHPLSLLVQIRKECIDAYCYTNKSDFVYDYYRNKQSALERLLQEPAHNWKMERFKTNDPKRIYDTYLEQGKYSHMTQVALFA